MGEHAWGGAPSVSPPTLALVSSKKTRNSQRLHRPRASTEPFYFEWDSLSRSVTRSSLSRTRPIATASPRASQGCAGGLRKCSERREPCSGVRGAWFERMCSNVRTRLSGASAFVAAGQSDSFGERITLLGGQPLCVCILMPLADICFFGDSI